MKALEKADLQPGDIDVWEINEAFASVTLNSIRTLGINDPSRTKPTPIIGDYRCPKAVSTARRDPRAARPRRTWRPRSPPR
jgi:hypothetical protein